MLEAVDAAQSFLQGRKRSDLDDDQMLLFALVRAIEIIGEAATKVTEDTRASVPEIPWPAMAGMRNRLVHAYFDIDRDILWKTATVELRDLRDVLQMLCRAD